MKNIDYIGYRRLTRYDIGTPPTNSGFQRNWDLTLTLQGYFTQDLTPITEGSGIRQLATTDAISKLAPTAMGLLSNATKYVSTYNETLNSALNASAKSWADKFAGTALDVLTEAMKGTSNTVASEFGKQVGKEAAKSGAKTTASNAIGAANMALNAYSAIHGALGLANNWKDSSTFNAGDLANMSSKSTEYVNGVGYERYGGYDAAGAQDVVNAQNKAQKLGGITSGFEAGAGIGGLIGAIAAPATAGLSSLIGSGIGGILGAIGGGVFGRHARRKRQRQFEEAQQRWASASDAHNMQEESKALTTSIRNQFNATHGDKGINKVKLPNALVNNDEVIGTIKNGRIKDAFIILSDLPDRYDGIPVRLGDNNFVVGHKKDKDGIELNEKAKIAAEMFNSDDPILQNEGEKRLLATLKTQKHTPDNNPNPWDMFMADKGKNMKKCDVGAWTPIMAFGANELDNWAHKKEIDRMPVQSFNAYSPNPYLTQAGALMPTIYNIDPQRQAINDEARYVNYAINQSSYSPGLKMALLSSHWNKRMKAMSDLIGEKQQLENAMRANYAKWLSDVGAQEQQLISAYRQKYYEGLAQANARKFNALLTLRKDKRQNWNDFALNMYNVWWGNKNIGLYEQGLTNKQKNDVAKMSQNYWSPTNILKPYKIKSPFDKNS